MTDDSLKKMNELKQDILDNYERLSLNDRFTFSCNPGLSCFGACCHDVNIILTPYDVLRLKNRLGMSSEEFIGNHVLSPPISKDNRIPLIFLRMKEEEGKPCPFLTEKGCGVYEDRPWACRMYPLGVASQKKMTDPTAAQFYYIIKDDKCKGHGEGKEMTLAEYVVSQGVPDFERMNDLFKEVTLHPFFQNEDNLLPPQQVQMFFMACYNLDMFKRFIFNSRFFEVMEVHESVPERIKNDEEELLAFAIEWLRYSLFGEGSIKVKEELVEQRKKEMEEKKEQEEAK